MSLIRPAIETLEDSPIVEVWRMGYGDPDVIGMFAGEPDVPTPQFIRDAAAKSLAEGNTFYTPNRGIAPMREALSAKVVQPITTPIRMPATKPHCRMMTMIASSDRYSTRDSRRRDCTIQRWSVSAPR